MGTRNHPTLSNQPYFVTAVTKDRQPIFRNRQAVDLMLKELAQLRNELGFSLLAYAVMPDHIHLLVAPSAAADLSRIMQSVKGRFARLWNRQLRGQGSLWQPRYYESAVRTEAQLMKWIEYIHRNPVQAGFASTSEEYVYCSSGGRLGTDLDAYLSGSWPGRAQARPSEKHGSCAL